MIDESSFLLKCMISTDTIAAITTPLHHRRLVSFVLVDQQQKTLFNKFSKALLNLSSQGK